MAGVFAAWASGVIIFDRGPMAVRTRLAHYSLPRGTRGTILVSASTVGLLTSVVFGQIPRVVLPDRIGDEMPRPTDPGAPTPFDPLAHRLPDLASLSMGRWAPAEPTEDLFMGDFDTNGAFVRIDLTFAGLMNPPGPLTQEQFQPFLYGPNPVYGFVEIDMDRDTSTGGEVAEPQFRYLANAARFGGKPGATRFADRVAIDGEANDHDISTPPFIDRHGEEFHLALLGTGLFATSDITRVRGNGNWVFEAGEVWDIHGSFFHRAHGFEPFSLAKGSGGEYAPRSDLRFRHSIELNSTFVSLVFPLTNTGAGLMRGEKPEEPNDNPTDQASVHEGLADLELSALWVQTFPTGRDDEVLITGWGDKNPARFLDPTEWAATAIFGTSYTSPPPFGMAFVWTDVLPNAVRGDFNGSGVCDAADFSLLEAFIESHDTADGATDGTVRIPGFAAGFSVFDMNYDGYVDGIDFHIAQSPGDVNGDDNVDLADFGGLQNCFDTIPDPVGVCQTADINGDTSIDLDDIGEFKRLLKGPADGRDSPGSSPTPP